MTMCKKSISIAIVLLLLFGSIPTSVFAAADPKPGAPQNVGVYETKANDGSVVGIGLKVAFDTAFLKAVTPAGDAAHGAYCARIYVSAQS